MTTRNILQFHREKGRRYRHTNSAQTAVSARLDAETIKVLADETAVSGIRRNSLLNMAAQWYVSELDEARKETVSGSHGDTDGLTDGMVTRYLSRSLSCSQLAKLRHVCTALNITETELLTRAIGRFLSEFDKRPFNLLAD